MKLGFRCSEGSGNFDDALEQVEYAERKGWDSVWVAEHHGWDIIWPSSHMALAGFATRTETIELGTSITLLPQANPVRLAGEMALLDQISDGRFVLGVGAGWRRNEMENLGYDFESRGRRTTEHLKALQTLFTQSPATFDGEFVDFEEFELTPEPVQEPHPRIWVGGQIDTSLKRAARLGDAWFPVWFLDSDELESRFARFDEYVREAGDDPDDRSRPLLRMGWIAEDGDTARQELQNLFAQLIADYRERGANIPEVLQRAVTEDFEEFAEGRFIVGDPDECLEAIRSYERLGVDHVILKLYNPGMDHEQMMRFLELFGDEVIPHLD